MKPIVFWGATGQSIVLEEMLHQHSFYLAAVVDNNQQVSSPFEQVSVIHGKEEFEKWLSIQTTLFYYAIAIGGDKGEIRMEIGSYLKEKGLVPATLVHPVAYVSKNATLGEGVQILAQSAVCARAKLGNYTIINTSANVDHECVLGDGVHIGPGAKLAGCVEVGDYSFVGTGAIVLPRIKIGKNVVVGAGAVVTKNISDNAICFGNPAKTVSYKN